MAGDIVCNSVVEAIARIQSVLDPVDPDFIADFWIRIADPTRSIFLNEVTEASWHSAEGLQKVANKILERIAKFPKGTIENGVDIGNEAIEGIRCLIKHSSEQNKKSNIFTLFTTKFIDDDDARVELLRLIKQADDVFGHDPESKFDVVINAMNGRIGLQGHWYQLKFAEKKGFNRVRGFEVTSGTRERGIDVVLDINSVAAGDPLFYELKAGRAHFIDDDGAAQMFYHMENPPISSMPDGWKRYRMAINTTDDSVIIYNGGKLLDSLTTTTRYRNPPWNLLMQELDQSLVNKPPGFNFEEWVTEINFANPIPNDPNIHLVNQAREFMAKRFFEKEYFPEII